MERFPKIIKSIINTKIYYLISRQLTLSYVDPVFPLQVSTLSTKLSCCFHFPALYLWLHNNSVLMRKGEFDPSSSAIKTI